MNSIRLRALLGILLLSAPDLADVAATEPPIPFQGDACVARNPKQPLDQQIFAAEWQALREGLGKAVRPQDPAARLSHEAVNAAFAKKWARRTRNEPRVTDQSVCVAVAGELTTAGAQQLADPSRFPPSPPPTQPAARAETGQAVPAAAPSAMFSSDGKMEWYVAAFGGVTFPQPLSNIQGGGTIAGFTMSDLTLAQSGIYGGKVGWYSGDLPWLGFEAELFVASPHVKQQAFTFSGPTFSGVAQLRQGIHLLTTTSAINLLARYPDAPVQPYGGLGLALVNATLSNSAFSSSAFAPGLNVLAGVRGFLMEHLALFTEFKYTYARLSFDNVVSQGAELTTTYSVPAVVVGLSVHF